MDTDDLDDLDWVVWDLEVRDPHSLTEPGIAERTTAVMTDMAGSLGCVFDLCCDDDTVDGVPYYSWLVRVPSEQHHRRTEHGIPVVVAAMQVQLRALLPHDVDDWRVRPNRTVSLQTEAARLLHDAYADLLDPLEVALLGLRHDGAQDIEPHAQFWGNHDGVMTGTYAMWLCKDPHRTASSPPWVVLYAGLATDDDFWTGNQGLRRFVTPGTPLLLLPRPSQYQWLVTVTTGTFTPHRPRLGPAQAVGASHRWTGHDSDQLTRRAATDLAALFPAKNIR